jgi:hypothetical protein
MGSGTQAEPFKGIPHQAFGLGAGFAIRFEMPGLHLGVTKNALEGKTVLLQQPSLLYPFPDKDGMFGGTFIFQVFDIGAGYFHVNIDTIQ